MGKTKIKTIGEEELKEKKLDVRSEKIDIDKEIRNLKLGNSQTSNFQHHTPASNIQHPTSKKQRSKKYQKQAAKVDPQQRYPLLEAVKLAQEVSYSKFPGTLEAHINTNTKNLRGLVSLPHFAGRKLTILAFPSSLRSSGQVGSDLGDDIILGNDETIKDIEAGKITFDVLVTTPEWMPKLAKAAKILGPKGLMPNPKNGTITENLTKVVAELQTGKVEYKTEKDGQVVHLPVGRVDQPAEEIAANIKALYNTLGRSKIQKITLAPIMGPGVKVELGSI